jgi:hypothetical protein
MKKRNNNTELLIFGDSWGCGAWSTKTSQTFSNGDAYLETSFNRYYNRTTSHSIGGISNREVFVILTTYLNQVTKSGIRNSKILVIQTEPARDFIIGLNFNIETKISYIFKTVSYKDYVETYINMYYWNLNRIAVKYGTTINLIGGCSDIHPYSGKYPNLNVACDSFYSLVDPKYIPSIYSATFDITKLIGGRSSVDLDIITAAEKKSEIQRRQSGELFGWYPDNHPSRKGIDIWVDHMYNKLV